jgi:hypothetical protein
MMDRALADAAPPWSASFVVGALVACVFDSSGWLALGLALCAPLLVASLLHRDTLPLARAHAVFIVRAALVCVALSAAVLWAALSGPYSFHGTPIALGLTRVAPESVSRALQFLLFWLALTPLSFGMVWALGLLGLVRGLARDAPHARFARTSSAAAVGFLLVSQLVRSVVVNNDLGWRAHSVAYLLLVVWAAQALELLVCDKSAARTGRRVLAFGSLGLGLVTQRYDWPRHAAQEPSAVHDERIGFLAQPRAWQIVRRYAGPHELVLSNPDAYARMCPWAVNLNFMLLADRRSVFAQENWVRTYSHGMGEDVMLGLGNLVANAFGKQPNLSLLRALRDQLHVRVLLVDRKDPVWNTNALDLSHIYSRVHGETMFRVYAATDHSRAE